MNEKWWKNAVVYQIYPRSFKDSNGDGIGDLEGIYEKLDYLAELGIDVIWMSPVYKSPNDDNGYDISDYQDIMDDFGTMADFDRVLAKAHSLNIKIMMDLVVNHTSDEHKWFIESKKSKDNPYHDYYMWADPDKNGNPPNRWESCFSGSAWEYVESVGQFYLHSFSKKQPDLNWDNPKVRDEVFKMMTWWCDKGIDGFRMDVISMISKYPGLPDGPENGNGYTGNTSCDGPNIHKYLREMNEKVLSKYRLITVGECPGVNAEQAKKYANIDFNEIKTDEEAKKLADEHHIEYEAHHKKGDIISLFFEEFCEDKLVQPTFVMDHPIEISPLTKKKPDNPELVERFELFINGWEMCNAYSELNDPIDQRERFKAQEEAFAAGDEEANLSLIHISEPTRH